MPVRSFRCKCQKYKKREKSEIEERKWYSILHVQTAMKYLVTYSQCKIAKANCTNSASYDVKKKKEKKLSFWFVIHALNAYLLALSFYMRKSCKNEVSRANNTVHSMLPVRWFFYVSYVGVSRFSRDSSVQLSHTVISSKFHAFIASVSQNWCRCGLLVKEIGVWQEIDLLKISMSLLQIPTC